MVFTFVLLIKYKLVLSDNKSLTVKQIYLHIYITWKQKEFNNYQYHT